MYIHARIGLYTPVYHIGLYTHVGLYSRPNIRVYDPVGGLYTCIVYTGYRQVENVLIEAGSLI